MDSNAFLLSFGMKPEDFERTEGPIESDEGFVYEGWEARRSPTCPRCASQSCIIKDRYVANIRLRSDLLKTEVLICHRIKYVCKGCGKTFTLPLKGAMVGRSLTHLERAAILAELNQGDAFERAARAHGISKMEAGNDVAQTMIDAAYGYRNFERFRKRFLLMRWNKTR